MENSKEKSLIGDKVLNITFIKGTIPQFEKSELPDSKPVKPKGWGARHTLALLGFWAVAVNYMMRYNLSIAIVAMVGSKPISSVRSSVSGNDTSLTISSPVSACPYPEESLRWNESFAGENETVGAEDVGEFDWSPANQGLILGCFFWGYLAGQLPAGIISSRYGGKWPLGIGLLITAVLAILTPWAARTHVWLLIAFRVVQGFGEGFTVPAMHGLLANWAPPEERGQLSSLVYGGAQVGTALTMIISGYLIHGGVMGGWPSVFYVFGIVSIIWFVLWALFMYDKPSDHPRISREERNYIEKSIGVRAHSDDSDKSVPWKDIFLSMPFWAIIIGQAGHCWGLYTLLAQLPTYLKTVLQFDIKQNSWLSALPHIVMWIVSLTIPRIADWFIAKGIFRTTTLRKTCTGIAHVGSALALIAASYTGCDRLSTVFLLTMALGFNGTIYAGVLVNHVDIAPKYASVLMGISNTAGSFMGFAAPYVCGLLIDGDPSLKNWQLVFFIAAGIYIFDFIFFTAFATSEEQWWNRGRRNLNDTRDAGVLKKLNTFNKP